MGSVEGDRLIGVRVKASEISPDSPSLLALEITDPVAGDPNTVCFDVSLGSGRLLGRIRSAYVL